MIPPSTTISDEGRRTRRILVGVAVAIVALNLLLWVLNRFAVQGGVTGPVGSSYVTTRSGLAGLEGTLRRLGYSTERLRVPLDEASLDPDGTVVISDVGGARYAPAELDALDRFMREGGRLVVAGQAALVDQLLPDAPAWRATGRGRATLVGDLLGRAPVDPVPLSGFGSFEVSEDHRVFLRAEDGTAIGVWRPVGEGVFVWLADSHPLHNLGLARAEAAVMAIGVLDPFGTVMFDEFRHGYTQGGGVWDIIPPRWRVVLVLGGLAALAALIGYGRRFGPPYDTERRLPPGREEYLESVAGIMARSNDRREALSLIREEARRRLRERSDSPAEAARAAGLDPEETRAVLEDDESEETLVAADRALATLIREKR